MSTEDPGFWKDLAKHLWALLVPLGWWIWNKQDKRIEKVENDMDAQASQKSVDELGEGLHSLRNRVVTREDFKAHEERDERDRVERREAENKLFEKVDDLKDDMTGRFDSLKDLIIGRTR